MGVGEWVCPGARRDHDSVSSSASLISRPPPGSVIMKTWPSRLHLVTNRAGVRLRELEPKQVYVELRVDAKQAAEVSPHPIPKGSLTVGTTSGTSQLPQMKRQDFAILGAPGTGKTTLGAVISSGSLLHIHDEDSMDTSTLQMALIGCQADRHKIEEKIAEIRAQLTRLSWRSRQVSSSFSKANLGMPRANLDPDIVALPISRQAKYQKQWKRDGRCIQCGKQRHSDSAVYCPGCRTKNRVQARERMRRLTNAQRRNLGSISYRESGAVT
jgi:hypothetical protein